MSDLENFERALKKVMKGTTEFDIPEEILKQGRKEIEGLQLVGDKYVVWLN